MSWLSEHVAECGCRTLALFALVCSSALVIVVILLAFKVLWFRRRRRQILSVFRPGDQFSSFEVQTLLLGKGVRISQKSISFHRSILVQKGFLRRVEVVNKGWEQYRYELVEKD